MFFKMVAERGKDQDNERDRELPRDNTLKSNNEVVSLRVPRGAVVLGRLCVRPAGVAGS